MLSPVFLDTDQGGADPGAMTAGTLAGLVQFVLMESETAFPASGWRDHGVIRHMPQRLDKVLQILFQQFRLHVQLQGQVIE
jgi:hypothetical protein